MPNRSAGLANKTLAVYVKDLRLELRTRYALNAILMFGVTTLAVVSFAVGQTGLSPKLLAALYWVIMFFSAMSGLSQGFVREEETGTALALKLTADPTAVYLGKLFFNFSLLSTMTIIITPLFFVFTDAPNDNLAPFVLILILGVIGLCGATTLIAAIIAKAAVKGALFAVLSFPLLLTLLIGLISASQKVFDGQTIMEIGTDLQFLVAYAVIMITGSILLFKFVWQE
ncbi:MAG: heme exporter protein CcmB [candidate division Zixibacteria bacterium]|nr:heme exporter protein CcmB [candidate division Zixibacteria bacterium]